jgi:hypothetical protein
MKKDSVVKLVDEAVDLLDPKDPMRSARQLIAFCRWQEPPSFASLSRHVLAI